MPGVKPIARPLIFQQAALARPKGVQPVVANHRLSAAFSFSRRLSPPKPFEPTSFQLVVVQSGDDLSHLQTGPFPPCPHWYKSLQPHRFPSNSLPPSSSNLSCRTSRCPSVDPGANSAIIASSISS